jgi:D-aspartate ligase
MAFSSRPQLAASVTAPAASRTDAAAGSAVALPELPARQDFDERALPVESSPVALIDNFGSPTLAFAVSLGRRGVPLHFYGNGAGHWSRYSSRRLACPPVEDADRFIPWLRRRIQSGEIQRIAPTTDLISFYVSMLREDFPPEVRRTIAPLVELERSLIKTRFGAACVRSGQAVPFTEAPDDVERGVAAAEHLGFPLMLKPKSHLVVGDERGRLISDMRELRAAYRPYEVAPGRESLAERYPELRWPLLQKYVPSARTRVFSVSGYKDLHGGILASSLSCKRRQWPPDTGISTAQFSWNDTRILSGGLETVDKLVSRGLFELELLQSGTELLAIELNPRAFGFIGLDVALGNDLPWLWFQSTLRPLDVKVRSDPRHVLECRLAIPYTINRCINALLGVRSADELEAAYSGSAPRSRTIPMLGDWDDPLPMLLSNLWLLRHPGSLIRPYVRAALAERRRIRTPAAWRSPAAQRDRRKDGESP